MDEIELVSRLGRLPDLSRVAFATACACRLAQPYQKARNDIAIDAPDLLAPALSNLWRLVAGEEVSVDWSAVADQLVEQIPDEDEMASPACQVLDDALASAAYAARAAIAFDPREAAWSARRLYEATDAFAQRSLDFTVYSPEIERSLLSHPVVQRELSRQVRDLTELESDALDAGVAALRTRAEIETAL